MMSAEIKVNNYCKYCENCIEDIVAEGLCCIACKNYVHIMCLRRQCVPGGLEGDIFFTFTCMECSKSDSEVFIRDKISWLQAITISLYHLQNRSPGLARKGYFHWKIHIVKFIDKYWEILFRKDMKRKKQWTGAISGSLSNYSPHLFRSGTTVFNEQGWWTLSYPKLTPNVIYKINCRIMIDKQKAREQKVVINDVEKVHEICLEQKYLTEEELTASLKEPDTEVEDNNQSTVKCSGVRNSVVDRKALMKTNLLPTLENYNEIPKKFMKFNESGSNLVFDESISQNNSRNDDASENHSPQPSKTVKFLDPFCHYNISFKTLSQLKCESLKTKLLGGIREDLILSPYSGIYLKPFIRRDTTSKPLWLQFLAELQLKVNDKLPGYVLPPRAPLDYTYVQPEHIPAINSLCNQFFWPGIDLTDCLQCPDFSCVVLYRKLIVAFAFLVPDVKVSENYMSFIFTRPSWRNCGIARFMIYHLIQTSIGKDITLHVSINSPALFLYQKFGFKVEHVALDFYDKYIRHDAKESKHAFFCRLER